MTRNSSATSITRLGHVFPSAPNPLAGSCHKLTVLSDVGLACHVSVGKKVMVRLGQSREWY